MAETRAQVSAFEGENRRHLSAAQGYLELGMFLDADTELDNIEPELRHAPEVLEVRAQLYSALGKLELMLVVTNALVRHDPDNVQWTVWRAFATRRAQSLEAARSILLEAVERHPEAAIFHYNLACYECQLGELEVAKSRSRKMHQQLKKKERRALRISLPRNKWPSA